MTKNRKKTVHRSRDTRHLVKKVHEDGKAIASLEEAVHKVKNRGANGVSGTNHGYNKTFGGMVDLMGREEYYDAAYILSLSDVERFAARIPPSQTLGYVPVDLYRKTEFAQVTTNANNLGFFSITSDQWSSGQGGILASGGAGTYAPGATVTQASYGGAVSPSSNVVLPGGVANLNFDGTVSSDFTQGAQGTEYIQVGSISTLTCTMPPNANAANSFVGTVTVAYTLDPERYPLAGTNVFAVEESAMENDSQIIMRQFDITPGGLFVPRDRDDLELGAEGPVRAFSALSSIAIPVTNDSYKWRRIDFASLNSGANTVPAPNQVFFIQSPSGTVFDVRCTFLWQTERYPSNRVTQNGAGPNSPNWWLSKGNQIAGSASSAVQNHQVTLAANHMMGHHNLPHWPEHLIGFMAVPPSATKADRAAILGAPAIIPADKIPTAKPVRKHQPKPPVPQKGSLPHRGKRMDGKTERIPTAARHATRHFLRNLGQKAHPLIGQAAVISDRCDVQPGFHAQLAANPAALGNFVPDSRAAAALCGCNGGVNAVDQLEEPSMWSSLLKGGMDIMSMIGPLLALL